LLPAAAILTMMLAARSRRLPGISSSATAACCRRRSAASADRQAPAAAASSPAEPKLQIEQDKKRLYIKWSERNRSMDGVADARLQRRSSVIRIAALTVRFDRPLSLLAAAGM